MKLKVPKYQQEGQDIRKSHDYKCFPIPFLYKHEATILVFFIPIHTLFTLHLQHNRGKERLIFLWPFLQIIFLPSPNLYSFPFNTVPLFLSLSEVEAKETQCFFYSDIIWSTLAISLYIYIVPSLGTQRIPFLILCKW